MQNTFLNHRRFLWFKISLISALLLVISYIPYSFSKEPNGGTLIGLTYGTIGLIAILLLMYQGIRKRRYRSTFGTVQDWLSFHVYMGVLTLIIIPLHAGFQFHADIHGISFYLLVIVVFSGLVGTYLYRSIPDAIRLSGADLIYGKEIDTQINKFIQKIWTLSKNKSDLFVQVCEEAVHSGLPDKHQGWRLVFCPAPSTASSRLPELQAHLGQIPMEEREDFKQLTLLFGQKMETERRFFLQIQNKNRLEAWLYLHLPLSITMLIAVAIHLYLVLYY